MKISGMEKLTLTDYPGHLACILFTQGCNFKCPFCQNSPLIAVHDEGDISEEYVFNYLNKRKNVLEGVVVSGGEPTVQKDLPEFIEKIKSLGLKVKLDTNGSNYLMLKDLLDRNLLDYVAMDLKNDFEGYPDIVGVKPNMDNIKKSMDLLKSSKIPFEFRTTIIKEFHDMDKLKKLVKLVDGSKYFIQNFQDSEFVVDKSLHEFSSEELEEIKETFKDFTNVEVRGI